MPVDRPEGAEPLAVVLARTVRAAPDRLAEVAASLARPVLDEDGLSDMLSRAVGAAVTWLPEADFAGITLQHDDEPVTVAHTDARVLTVDQLQITRGGGPCLHAQRTGAFVSAPAAEAAQRWPDLVAPAREQGVLSYLAVPLVDGEVVRGSINLYSRDERGFGTLDRDLLAVLSAYVSRGLAELAALQSSAVQVTQLRRAMRSRAPIEQAKGILMAVHRVDADTAFGMLRTQSQTSNTKLAEVASRFVATQAAQPFVPKPVGDDDAGPPAGTADFQSAFDHAPIGIAIADPHGVLLTVNGALARLLGGSVTGLAGTTLFGATHPDDLPTAVAACTELREGAALTCTQQLRLRSPHGSSEDDEGSGGAGALVSAHEGSSPGWLPVVVSTAKVLDAAGRASHLVVHVEDVTDHHNRTRDLEHQALHDHLTGLPNRALFLDRLAHGAARHHRAGAPLTVLFCDVDDFKVVNDTHGHLAGDAVLEAIARRLAASLRPGDTAARLGGDEFALLCENTDHATATRIAERLRRELSDPIEVQGRSVLVTVSVGTATHAPGGDAADTMALLAAADTVMYTEKAAGLEARRT